MFRKQRTGDRQDYAMLGLSHGSFEAFAVGTAQRCRRCRLWMRRKRHALPTAAAGVLDLLIMARATRGYHWRLSALHSWRWESLERSHSEDAILAATLGEPADARWKKSFRHRPAWKLHQAPRRRRTEAGVSSVDGRRDGSHPPTGRIQGREHRGRAAFQNSRATICRGRGEAGTRSAAMHQSPEPLRHCP